MSVPASEPPLNPYRWWVLLGLWAASVMEVLDTTIVNVALPQMAGNLSATTTEIAWVATSYALANVIVLPMTAFLVARFGRKRYLMFSIALFLVASFSCGVSHSLDQLVFWRIVQGGAGAALLSTAQATLRQIFPPREFAMTQAIFILGIVVAPTLGPTLGGWITDNYAWGWLFFVNIPIGIFSLFLVYSFLFDPPAFAGGSSAPIDWPGIGLLTLGIGTLQYVLEEGNKDDWFDSPLILRLSVVAALSLGTLLWWLLSPKNRHPVVNLRVLKNRELSASLALFLMLGFGLYGGLFLYPVFVQNVLRFTPTQTGLTLLPGGIATAVASIICGRALGNPKVPLDPRVLVFAGVVLFSISMWDLGHLSPLTGSDDTQAALILRGFGLGFLFVPLNQVAFATLKPQELQQAAGLISLTRQLGGSFGIAILATYLTNQGHFHAARVSEKLTAANPYLVERQAQIAQRLVHHGYSPADAAPASGKLLGMGLSVQSQTMAFNDCFLLLLLAMVITAPAILLLKKPKLQRH